MNLAKPLEGLLVIDLTRVLAGPYCTMLLCDMGAFVIKVEMPEKGDDSRYFNPMIGNESAYFMSINRGKKSITLNLKNKKGKELFLKLVEKADILVENFRPGVMDRLDLSYEKLSKINPSLIYASSTGYGQTGPKSKKAAYDLIIQGLSGMMSITGPDEDTPTKVGSSIADIFSGTFTCIGILAALQNRQKTGKGQMVDVAMLDSMISVLENAIVRYSATGSIPKPIGNRHPSIAPFASFETSNGMLNIAIGNNNLWKKFCNIIGKSELINDERFHSNPLRVKNIDVLTNIITRTLKQKSSEEWLEIFEVNNIPSGKINNVEEMMNDPQVIAREMLVDVIQKSGPVKMPGVPIKFSRTPAEISGPAPELGEHNEEIFSKFLDLDNVSIKKLKKEGII
ncbi:MAG: CoA transferase [Kosmotoga sp.]|nr:MAG: CoA transferase [Kosmotoga sp.]